MSKQKQAKSIITDLYVGQHPDEKRSADEVLTLTILAAQLRSDLLAAVARADQVEDNDRESRRMLARQCDLTREAETRVAEERADAGVDANQAKVELARLRKLMPPDVERSPRYVGEGSWSVFAGKVCEERDFSRRCAAAWKQLAKRKRDAASTAIMAFKDASRLRSKIQQARIKAEDERDSFRAIVDVVDTMLQNDYDHYTSRIKAVQRIIHERDMLLLCRQAVEAMQAFRKCGQQPSLDPGGSSEYQRTRHSMEQALAVAVAALELDVNSTLCSPLEKAK